MVPAHVGLAHVDRLEAALEGRVLLHVLLVLVQGGGAHAAQLAAGERRLQHVRGVHRALGRARAHHGVQLVDEQDDVALGLLDLLEHRLQAVFELAAVLGSRDEGAEVESDDALVLERLGDVSAHHALGETFDDRGLAHARLADQDRVVLGPAREHLDHTPHLVVPPDHRIELALPREPREVATVALEGLVAALRVRVVHPLVAADLLQDLEERLSGHPVLAQQILGRPLGFEQTEQHVLGRDVLVLEGLGLAQGLLQGGIEPGRNLGGGSLGARQRRERLVEVGSDPARGESQLAEGRRDDPALLDEQRLQQMLGRELGVIASLGLGLGRRQGFLGLHRELIEAHSEDSFDLQSRPRSLNCQ